VGFVRTAGDGAPAINRQTLRPRIDGCRTPYIKPTRNDAGMEPRSESSAITSRYRSTRWRSASYWIATAVVAGELPVQHRPGEHADGGTLRAELA
jgi:hypothetical protein